MRCAILRSYDAACGLGTLTGLRLAMGHTGEQGMWILRGEVFVSGICELCNWVSPRQRINVLEIHEARYV